MAFCLTKNLDARVEGFQSFHVTKVWIFIFSALRVLVLSASRSSTTTVVTAREHVQTRRTGRVKVVKPVAMDVLRIPLVELEMIVTGCLVESRITAAQ